MDRGIVGASFWGGGGFSGSGLVWKLSGWLKEAPAWRVAVDECKDREVTIAVGVCEETDEFIRLKCG